MDVDPVSRVYRCSSRLSAGNDLVLRDGDELDEQNCTAHVYDLWPDNKERGIFFIKKTF